MAYLYLSGSTAKACALGEETIGTFKSSYPQSMTFVKGRDTLVFPLQFEKDGVNLLVGVPQQSLDRNEATWYRKTTTYTCMTASRDAGTTAPVAQGQAVFFSNLKATGYAINVSVRVGSNDRTASISTFQHSSSPGCTTNSGAARFGGLAPATYTWRATGYRWHASGTPTPTTWGGSVTITSNGCASVQIN